MMRRPMLVLGALVMAVGVVAGPGASMAAAEPVDSASASAFAAEVLGPMGTEVVAPTPTADATLPPGEDDTATTVDVDGEPVAVNGTLIATANTSEESDIESALTTVDQDVAGPYNARGLGQIEDLDVLLDVPNDEVSLVSADAVRAEAVAVCTGDTVEYSATSEIIDLRVGGTMVPITDPIDDLLDGLGDVLEQSGLDAVVDVDRNVVTDLAGGGIAVDALVVTVLDALGDPIAEVTLGHAEVGPATCGDDGVAPAPECSDGIDNDGDGLVDFPADPGCDTAGDDDETDDGDGTGDGGVAGTGVGSGDGGVSGTGVGSGDDGSRGALPRTGGDAASATLALGAGAIALMAMALRRRALA